MDSTAEKQTCPICYKLFANDLIQQHVNKCIFLNCDSSDDMKRKRSVSPSLFESALKSPKSDSSSRKTINKKIDTSSKKTVDKNNLPSTSTNEKLTGEDDNTKFSFITPLAKQVEPKSLDDFFGQQQILGKNTVLRKLLEKQEIPNMILWGPPGCGKTSLSNVIKEKCRVNSDKLRYISLCAASSGVKEVQNIIADAKMQQKFGKQTVLFMDEIHRFNKKQQDVFLLHVEKGEIILIGATTENPSFIINNALLSRCRVIVLEKLEPESVMNILLRAVKNLNVMVVEEGNMSNGSLNVRLSIEKDGLDWLANTCDGDARIALSTLQLLLQQNEKNELITTDYIKEELKKSHLLYDRQGEEHYNIISAMHKSIRGSDDNAALYWTTRMIVSGEDPRFIARRLVRAASEDIGNADPMALQLAVSTMQGCQLIGMPEADVLLAQCAIYLARAPKSREADSALAAAKRAIKECKGTQPMVPMHIRNAPTKLMRELGYGRLEKGKTASFMPEGLENMDFFK